MKRILFFISIFILAFTIPSYANDDLYITNWNVESNLMENGDLEISEDITFRFNNDFNGIFRDIVLNSTDGIEGLEVYEVVEEDLIPYELDNDADVGDSNVYKVNPNTDSQQIQVFSPSQDEDKTFRFIYSVNNVASLHTDTGELYYKYLGEENETFIESFSASISLPEFNIEDIYIFAHGPLHGTINFTDENLILLEIEDVEPNNLVEARVLYPATYTPSSNRTGSSDLDSILNEEQNFQEEIRENFERSESIKNNLNYISIIISGLGVIIMGLLYRITRRNPKIFREMNSLYPEDISPAELNIFRSSTLTPRSLTATIFDLARREYLTIEDINGKKDQLDLKFTKINKDPSNLLSHEVFFMDWLFNDIGDGKISSTKHINSSRKKSHSTFNKNLQKWILEVKKNLNARNYYDKRYRKPGIFLLLLSLASLVFGIISIVHSALYGIALVVISIALCVFSISLINRYSDKGYIQKVLWNDFNKEIKGKKESKHDNITEKHLIYAIAMDNSVGNIDDYKDSYSEAYFPLYYSYFFVLNKHGGSSFDDSISRGFYGYTGTSSSSSTSFGGDGFSGGGGGGAGGGGAGGF